MSSIEPTGTQSLPFIRATKNSTLGCAPTGRPSTRLSSLSFRLGSRARVCFISNATPAWIRCRG